MMIDSSGSQRNVIEMEKEVGGAFLRQILTDKDEAYVLTHASGSRQLVDGFMTTDWVEIRDRPQVKHATTETQPLTQKKSQFVSTDQIACTQRGTDMGIKHRDAECTVAIFSSIGVSKYVETEKLALVNRGSSDDRIDGRLLCESCLAHISRSMAESGCQVDEQKMFADATVETDFMQPQPQQVDDDEFYLVVGSQQELDAVTRPPKEYQDAVVACNIDESFETLHLCSNCKRPVSALEAAADTQQHSWSPPNSPLTPSSDSFEANSPQLEVEELGEGDDLDSSLKPPSSPRRVDFTKPRGTRATELSRAAATKKLLTTETEVTQQKPTFQRGTYMSRSCRVESRKGDPLAFITESRSAASPPTAKTSDSAPAVASSKPVTGLRRKVEITKRRAPQLPAGAAVKRRPITRPAKRPPATENVEPRSAGEEEEANDTVGPLPSEVEQWEQQQQVEVNGAAYDNPAMEDTERPTPRKDGRLVGDLHEDR